MAAMTLLYGSNTFYNPNLRDLPTGALHVMLIHILLSWTGNLVTKAADRATAIDLYQIKGPLFLAQKNCMQ